jgi:hypothetical protein
MRRTANTQKRGLLGRFVGCDMTRVSHIDQSRSLGFITELFIGLSDQERARRAIFSAQARSSGFRNANGLAA